MNLPIRKLFGLVLVLLYLYGNSQPSESGLVEYEFGYPFKTGVYYTFEDFKTNSPTEIGSFRVITRASEFVCRNGTVSDYIEYESKGETIRINGADIWGYAKRGSVYVTHKNMFYKILMFGGICFLDVIRGGKEDDEVQNPFNAATTEHFALLDAETGKTFDFRIKYLENLLSNDKEVYEEYLKSSLKRKDKKFVFLRKYNDKHKIYFPLVH
ncbi:MAG: hypothetical protein GXO89_17990 [Chlorobi bacterium]|nr:hypothetical protein [Chlorobiota bacterium]